MRWMGGAALKPFARPQRWLATWWTMVFAVIVGSMLPVLLLPHMPPGGDKVQHLLGYALLSAGAVQVFASRAALLRAAIGLIVMGVLIEVAQGTLTDSRSMDAMDALANTVGVLLGWSTLLLPMRDALLRYESKP